MKKPQDAVLVAFIAVGAVMGFSFNGGAAIGTTAGAALGMAATHVHGRHREAHQK